MIKRSMIVFVAIFLVLALSFTMAVNNKSESRNHNFTNSNNHSLNGSYGQAKMNYGLCVSNFTRVKNDCFKIVKDNKKACVFEARNVTIDKQNKTLMKINREEIKNKTLACLSDYKTDVSNCKVEFKNMKGSCNFYKCKVNQTFVNNTCI